MEVYAAENIDYEDYQVLDEVYSEESDDESNLPEEWIAEREIHDRQSAEDRNKKVTVERDLMDFLRLGRQHDVWKEEIAVTKAEIKKLEREIQMGKRRREDRNQ